MKYKMIIGMLAGIFAVFTLAAQTQSTDPPAAPQDSSKTTITTTPTQRATGSSAKNPGHTQVDIGDEVDELWWHMKKTLNDINDEVQEIDSREVRKDVDRATQNVTNPNSGFRREARNVRDAVNRAYDKLTEAVEEK